jgi:hypothetical protein
MTTTLRRCPACRDEISVRGILIYKRIYLCETHRGAWDRENCAAEAREQRATS